MIASLMRVDAIPKSRLSAISGAAFLMATSAIGPGFLTQTARFTDLHRADFAFAILASILIDIGAQWNVWRVIGVTGLSGPELAHRLSPPLAILLRALVVAGGFVFNIGNIAGCALGLGVFGVDSTTGAVVSGLIAVALLAKPNATAPLDWFVRVLGVVMIVVTAALMIRSSPDYALAASRAIFPQEIATGSILTLVGGTVGGYITFSGAHRLLASGVVGRDAVKEIDNAALRGIAVTGAMRAILFLAILGVLSKTSATLGTTNPAAEAFRLGAGPLGEIFFGIVLWCAAITSVVGCTYTSMSFLPGASRQDASPLSRWIGLLLFIIASLAVFLKMGRPADLLVWAGGLNGIVLPVTIFVVLVATRSKSIVGDYAHPRAMTAAGVAAWIASVWIAGTGLADLAKRL